MLETLETGIKLTKTIRKKICLVGDFAVGKTSLVRRYIYGMFDEKYLTTIGVMLSQKTLMRDEHELRLMIWDLAGGEDFDRPETLYLRGAAGALILCDLSRADSLPSLERYTRQLWQSSPNAAVVLIGNKNDLDSGRTPGITESAIAEVAARLNVNYLLTSAKTGQNVERAFTLLADLIEFKSENGQSI